MTADLSSSAIGSTALEALMALPQAVLLFDGDDHMMMCNDAARKMLPSLHDLLEPGVSFETLTRAVAQRRVAIFPDDSATAWVETRMAAHQEPAWTMDLQAADGSWRHIYDRALPSGGRIISLWDITSIKRTDARLEDREYYLESILETVIDGIIVIDSSGTVKTFNPAAERLFGYSSEEIVGKDISILMPIKHGSNHQHYLDSYIHTGIAKVIGSGREVVGLHKDGTEFPIEIAVTELRQGTEKLFTGVVRDITARKQFEHALRENEQRLALAMEGSTEAIVDWDLRSNVLVTGDRAQAIMGAGPDQLQFISNWLTLLHPQDRQGYEKSLEALLNGDQGTLHFNKAVRLANPAPDGGERWVRHRALLLHDTAGSPVRLIGSVGDITETRRHSERLRAARNAAELANRAKSEFLANMSHELRTPLNAILGFTETIQAETFGPVTVPKYKEYLKDISDSGKHLLGIIEDILDVSCIEAGTLTLHLEPYLVRDLMRSTARLIVQRAESAGLVLEVTTCDCVPPTAWGDVRRLKQALLNLLANAVKFTPRGGRVTMACQCLNGFVPVEPLFGPLPSAPELDHGSGSGFFRISITDTGVGMAPEQIPLALKAFQRLEGSMERSIEGAGLGLPLAKSFVEIHGGQLIVESMMGKGTRVTVTLPFIPENPTSPAVRADNME